MAAEWLYVGQELRIYLQYQDLQAGETLVAEPGKSYQMRAVQADLSIPPDQLWQEAPSPPPVAKPISRAQPSVKTLPMGEGENN